MRRRIFVAGSLAAAAAATAWRAGLGRTASGAHGRANAYSLPDGRFLVRDAAIVFGTTTSMAVIHDDPDVAHAAIAEALDRARRIDALMSLFRPASEVSRLNALGALTHPDPHLVRVLEFSQQLAAQSDGAFDVTVQPLWTLFADCKRRGRMPRPEEVAAARSLVDWTALEVSNRKIVLGRREMAITLNGIAQGYAADLAMGALREREIHDALIDTGEFGAEGQRGPQQPWTIGIQHPRFPDAIIAKAAMDGRFLATSGDYATTFTDDFVYHHIFDPRTGVSPRNWSSVTVAAASGMEADGLTKPMMILERSRAHDLLSRFSGSGAAWIDKRGILVTSQSMRLSTI